MYVYCISSGEYEQYFESYYHHEKKFTDEEFNEIVLKCDELSNIMIRYLTDETDYPDLLSVLYGFKEMPVQCHFHQD